jgi:hypothetical protein
MTGASSELSTFTFDEDKLRKAMPFELRKTSVHGAFTVPPPPADFDPQTASPRERIRAGYLWKRPDAASPPVARAAWDRVMSRKWKTIVPEFGPAGRSHHLRRAPRQVSNGGYLNTSWAGGTINSSRSTPWYGVIAVWTIPQISQPPEASVFDEGFQGWEMSSWIGIDGYLPNNSNDLLQIGVTQQLLTNGQWGCFPWYEWWLKPPVPSGAPAYAKKSIQITGFTVNPGDTVWASVQYVQSSTGKPTSGYLYMGNETTGTSSGGIVLTPPHSADFNGSSVEWIVEAPDGGEGTSSLPKFTPVVFNAPVACGVDGIFGPWTAADTGFLLDIESAAVGGKPLTSSSFVSGSVTIDFIG